MNCRQIFAGCLIAILPIAPGLSVGADAAGNTPLHIAAAQNDIASLKQLLADGVRDGLNSSPVQR